MELVKMNKFRGEDRVNGRSSQANLENMKSWTRRGMRSVKHTVANWLSWTHINAHSTADITRQNNGDKGKANHASTGRVRRQKVGERGLPSHPLRYMPSRVCTRASSVDCVTRRMCDHYDHVICCVLEVWRFWVLPGSAVCGVRGPVWSSIRRIVVSGESTSLDL